MWLFRCANPQARPACIQANCSRPTTIPLDPRILREHILRYSPSMRRDGGPGPGCYHATALTVTSIVNVKASSPPHWKYNKRTNPLSKNNFHTSTPPITTQPTKNLISFHHTHKKPTASNFPIKQKTEKTTKSSHLD
ncbi:hypothetical protein JTE90_022780 [Oedothorax gibbosus]|uniref:Uncharacterized protein n=1 Tax=Oedothorax gibbosus TaxID=931172 RepID=A0AAV6U8D1_9ARAC|nr:hypothetical protein JTE90_022780 [Oedothorax gibbosus]